MSILSNVFSVRFAVVAGSALLLSASAFASSCGTDITAQFTGKAPFPKSPAALYQQNDCPHQQWADLPGHGLSRDLQCALGDQAARLHLDLSATPSPRAPTSSTLGYDSITGGHDKQADLSFVQLNNSGHVQLRVVGRPVKQSPSPGRLRWRPQSPDLGVFEPPPPPGGSVLKTRVTSGPVYGMPTIDRFVVGDLMAT
jgi:hypothetical protein